MQIDEKTLIAVAAVLARISQNIANALEGDDVNSVDSVSLLSLSESTTPVMHYVS